LARQDRSRKELEEKLTRWYTPNAVDFAVQKAEELGYIKPPAELALRYQNSHRQKGRGHYRISHELKKRGLPQLPMDREAEYSCCQSTFLKKFGETRLTSQEERAKAARYLTSRGFDLDTVKRVIYEK